MYSLCVRHLFHLICVSGLGRQSHVCLPSPLFVKQNVPSLITTAGIWRDVVAVRECVCNHPGGKDWAVFTPIQSVVEKHWLHLINYHVNVLGNQLISIHKNQTVVPHNILFVTSLLKP